MSYALMTLIFVLICAFIKIYNNCYSYWKKRGFPHLEGHFPLGSNPSVVWLKKFPGLVFEEIYQKLDGHRIGGFYTGRRPDLIVRDPELIKNIFIKDFDHFRYVRLYTSYQVYCAFRDPQLKLINEFRIWYREFVYYYPHVIVNVCFTIPNYSLHSCDTHTTCWISTTNLSFCHRDRNGNVLNKSRPLTQHLFELDGWMWRPLRVKLTPTFTSGKLKTMFDLFELCANRLEEKLKEISNLNDGIIDIKETMACLTTDIIASCAFGIDVDSLNNPDEPFRQIGKQVFRHPNHGMLATDILYALFPFLRRRLRISRHNKLVESMFLEGISKTIESREKNNIQRNDFLQLMINMRDEDIANKTHDKDSLENHLEMDLGLIAAQCFVFFLAGFETSSSVQSCALFEIAHNKDIQNQLKTEIIDTIEKHGKITYTALQEMTYLDQVINETIRKYPTLHTLTRVCTKPYKIPGTDLIIEKDIRVNIPVFALHHDPKYFPNPEKFDPERFSEENKASIIPYSYLPFGEGQRNCIGKRFGLLQTKIGIVSILKNYSVSTTPMTSYPLKFANAVLVISSVVGQIQLKLNPV